MFARVFLIFFCKKSSKGACNSQRLFSETVITKHELDSFFIRWKSEWKWSVMRIRNAYSTLNKPKGNWYKARLKNVHTGLVGTTQTAETRSYLSQKALQSIRDGHINDFWMNARFHNTVHLTLCLFLKQSIVIHVLTHTQE